MNDAPALAQAVTVLRRGGSVAYPTETVWGLAAQADGRGLETLRQIKGRSELKAIQVSCTFTVARQVMAEPEILTLFDDLLPGPLTLVVQAGETCPRDWHQDGWIGLRFPRHEVAQALIERSGGALLTTSCNPSGAPAATTYQEALDYGLADVTLANPFETQAAQGRASTVVRIASTRSFEVLREGDISATEIAERLGRA